MNNIKMKINAPKLKTKVLKELWNLLEHDKEFGIYDKDLDLYFENLNTWCVAKHGVSFDEIC
jgi:hypothetical protein